MRKSCTTAIRAERNEPWLRERRPDQRAVKYLTKREVQRIFRAIAEKNTRDRLLFNLIYRHSLRRLEATLLWLDDARDGKLWVARAKDGVSGAYPLHPESRELLRAYVAERREDDCPYLFRGKRRTTEPLSVEAIDRLFRTYAAKADVPEIEGMSTFSGTRLVSIWRTRDGTLATCKIGWDTRRSRPR